MHQNSDTTIIESLVLLRETPNAFLFALDEEKFGEEQETVWLPKSQITVTPNIVDNTFDVEMPEWLAIEKELV